MFTLLIVLATGCAKMTVTPDSYCDLANPIFFGSDTIVNELAASDPQLLREIVKHNEKHKAICK
jgi:prephenate dehydrogenase